jgi:SAM-dependent methyltransferase
VRIDDPGVVRQEYSNEVGLAGRKAAYAGKREGPDPKEIAFRAVAEPAPQRVLEVGCGEGELAERIQDELGARVVAVDQSERMVELTRARGVDARVGDVQDLPFADASFDCVVAAWMLYHVPAVERAIAELARVVRPGGRLVAPTNGAGHLRELWSLVEMGPIRMSFAAESGAELLGQRFTRVERRDAFGWVEFDHAAAQSYVGSSMRAKGRSVPPFEGTIRVRVEPVVFVADR